MLSAIKLGKLRETITENLRVQRDGQEIDYINVGTALQDACAKQNHAIFARRGCGKTLLLHHSSRQLRNTMRSIYLNCEDFKRHSFPNVLIEILISVFRELDRNLVGWFGRKKRAKEAIKAIVAKLSELQQSADKQEADVTSRSASENSYQVEGRAAIDIDALNLNTSATKGTK